EQALFRMAGHDGGTGFAAREHVAERIEAQAALRFLDVGAVALEALLGEHRPDLRLEELGGGGRDGRGLRFPGLARPSCKEHDPNGPGKSYRLASHQLSPRWNE